MSTGWPGRTFVSCVSLKFAMTQKSFGTIVISACPTCT